MAGEVNRVWTEEDETRWTTRWNRAVFPIAELEERAIAARHDRDGDEVLFVGRLAKSCIGADNDPPAHCYSDLARLCTGMAASIEASQELYDTQREEEMNGQH
jgi:hypothetical protein